MINLTHITTITQYIHYTNTDLIVGGNNSSYSNKHWYYSEWKYSIQTL